MTLTFIIINLCVTSFISGYIYNDWFSQTKRMYLFAFSSLFLGTFYLAALILYSIFWLLKELAWQFLSEIGITLLYYDFLGKHDEKALRMNLPKFYHSGKYPFASWAIRFLAKKYDIEL